MKEFFEEQQSRLLTLVNTPVVGKLVRKYLFLPSEHEIVLIKPNHVIERTDENSFRYTGWANNQIQDALISRFGFVLSVIHDWDTRIANKYAPVLNVGLDTYSSQPDETSGVDNYMDSGSAGNNNGTSANYIIGESSVVAAAFRGLIKFDFSSIPSNATSSSATFSLWHHAEFASNTRTFRIFRQKRAWSEASSSWNEYDTSTAWQSGGGFGADDCEQTGIASLSQSSTESNGEKQWTNWTTTSLDAMFGSSPSFTNNGFLIKADTENADEHQYRSSSHSTAAERPKMVIEYTTPGGQPIQFFT